MGTALIGCPKGRVSLQETANSLTENFLIKKVRSRACILSPLIIRPILSPLIIRPILSPLIIRPGPLTSKLLLENSSNRNHFPVKRWFVCFESLEMTFKFSLSHESDLSNSPQSSASSSGGLWTFG